MAYTPGQGSGTSTGATPGSSKNTVGLTKAEYNYPVTVGRTPGTAFDKGSSSDITKPLGQVLKSLYDMPKEKVEALQERLIKAGLLSRKSITKGIADEDTVAAWEKALLRAVNSGKTPDTVLDEAAAAGAPDVDAATTRQPFSPTVSSPEEIKAALEAQLPKIIGYSPPDEELAGLVSLYQSLQVKAQKQSYDTATAGGTSTEVVPIDVFAEQQGERLHPQDAQNKKLANAAKVFQAVVSAGTPETATF